MNRETSSDMPMQYIIKAKTTPATTYINSSSYFLHLRHTCCAKHRLGRFVKGLHKTDFPNCPPLLGQDQVCTREAKPRLVGNKAYWFSPSTKIKRKHLQSWANLQPAYPCHRSGSAHSNAPRNVISCWKRHKSLGTLNPALAPSYAITQGPLFRGKARGS